MIKVYNWLKNGFRHVDTVHFSADVGHECNFFPLSWIHVQNNNNNSTTKKKTTSHSHSKSKSCRGVTSKRQREEEVKISYSALGLTTVVLLLKSFFGESIVFDCIVSGLVFRCPPPIILHIAYGRVYTKLFCSACAPPPLASFLRSFFYLSQFNVKKEMSSLIP